MDHTEIVSAIKDRFPRFSALSSSRDYADEICVKMGPDMFRNACMALHKILSSPVMTLFAVDERAKRGKFLVNCVFADTRNGRWVTLSTDVSQESPRFESLASSIYSANLFEREMREMFGIEPEGNPDLRRLRLHDEVWQDGNYPLRKDFHKAQAGALGEYKFGKVKGEGIFEVPVGPVHAGIIGPGHFRFSVAGEPIINLEIRLGFTHRGVEKLFEGKNIPEAIYLAERISGDSVFAHSMAFTQAAEKISRIAVSAHTARLRAIFLELERMYNHVNDIGGIAIDAGFSFPQAYASIIKEAILQLNEKLTGSRYLREVNVAGGLLMGIDRNKKAMLKESVTKIKQDFAELVKILYSSVSFMDRVDATGILRKKTAEDLGVIGLAGRASGIRMDVREHFSGIYKDAKFRMITQESGDVLARLRVRMFEFEQSCRLIMEFADKLSEGEEAASSASVIKEGNALGCAEGWRGPVLYWLKTDAAGYIERCKITDASFRNWQGLSYAVIGDIIPDFPLCNKSFDLSYTGSDL